MEEISYCGIKCNECPVYIATEKNDDVMRINLARDYSTEKCSFTKDDINCKGCHFETVKDKLHAVIVRMKFQKYFGLI